MKLLRTSIMVLVSLASAALFAGQTAESLTLATGETVRFWHYQPADIDGPAPLVLFLHGGGESGDDLDKVKNGGVPAMIEAGHEFPAIVLSPLNPETKGFWDEDRLARFLDAFIEQHEVDEDRIYITGLSRGAYGSWRLALENPSRFAAMVVISGAAPAPYSVWMGDLPVWAFHGEDDEPVPVDESQRMVAAINRQGGNAKLTVYPGVGHDAWTQTYANPAVWEWLFAHRRSDRP